MGDLVGCAISSLRTARGSVMCRLLLPGLHALVVVCSVGIGSASITPWAFGQEVTRDRIAASMGLGQEYLRSRQLDDGTFPADGVLTHRVEATALATLALLKSGLPPEDPSVRRSVEWLRRLPPEEISRTGELALSLLVFSTVAEPEDLPRIQALAERLAAAQTEEGTWPYRIGGPQGDVSISHFVLLGLRDAARAGATVSPEVWRRGAACWRGLQNADGGWSEFASSTDKAEPTVRPSTVPATLAGVATLSFCEEMLALRGKTSTADCGGVPRPADAVRGIAWLNARARSVPDFDAPEFYLTSHLYGVELANRLEGKLFESERAWHLAGTKTLLKQQDRVEGRWRGNNEVIATSYAMLYLANELAPVLVGRLRLDSSSPDGRPADRPHDIWHLTEQIRRYRRWPRLLAARELEFPGARPSGPVADTRFDARVLFLTGRRIPALSVEQLAIFREYLYRGGTIFASPAGDAEEFESSLRKLIDQLMADGGPTDHQAPSGLAPLSPHHPVYQSPLPLAADSVRLYGVHSGCRTVLFYSPDDLSCLWERAAPAAGGDVATVNVESPGEMGTSLRIGLNVVTYAAGNSRPQPHTPREQLTRELTHGDALSRGRLRIAQVRHAGDWNVAPRALERLLRGVNQTWGPIAALPAESLRLDDPRAYEHLLLFLHGSRSFTLSPSERDALRTHLKNGGVLLADACCGSESFDRSFREAIASLFPGQELKRIPADHPLFSESPSDPSPPEPAAGTPPVEHHLEGLTIDGRLAVIYSRSDLSCAIDGDRGAECSGYAPAEALRLATQIVVHALLQDGRGEAGR